MSDGLIKPLLAGNIVRQNQKDLHASSFFRMSSIGSCQRKQIAQRAGLPEVFPPSENAILKMWMGTQYGKLIQGILEQEGFLVLGWTERELHYRSYKGHTDGLTRKLPDDGTQGAAIVELKTSSDDAVTKYPLSEGYFWQGLTYCKGAGVRRLVIFQIGREYALSREQVVFLTEEWNGKIDTEITEIEKAWDEYCKTKVLPPCKHRFGWEDKLCGYREPKETKRKPTPYDTTPESRELAGFIDEVNQQEIKK